MTKDLWVMGEACNDPAGLHITPGDKQEEQGGQGGGLGYAWEHLTNCACLSVASIFKAMITPLQVIGQVGMTGRCPDR
jgi:hypothetical protein